MFCGDMYNKTNNNCYKNCNKTKHIPLNSYVSLNKPIYDEESDRTLLDIIATSIVTDPEELIISKEELKI